MRLRTAISILLTVSIILFATSCGGGGGGGAGDGFTVNYRVNGAESGSGPEGQFSSGDEVVIRENTGNLAKAGYLFDGWNTRADGTGKSYAPGTKYKGDDLVLYPKWAAIYLYEVVSGGSPAPALDRVQKAPGTSARRLIGLTEKGMQLFSFNIPPAMDGYTVTEIGASAFELCTNIREVTIPETVTSIGDFAFNGCSSLASLVLMGTTPPALGGGALDACPVTVAVPISAVDTYKAAEGWDFYSAIISGYSNEPHTVTFDGQGATTPASPSSITVNPPSVTVGTLPAAPKKTGYSFGGWYTGTGGTGTEFTASTVVTGNITIYAKWDSYSYTVNFDDQGATTPVSPASKTVNSPATTIDALPLAPEKTGQIFVGWYTQTGGGGTQFTANTPVTGNITVYAYWADYSYTVTFDDQGATTHVNPSSKTVNSPATTVGSLPTAPQKTGFVFGGWYTQAGGGGSEFTAGTPVTGNITVYAKWDSYSYTVNFDDQGATTPVSPASKTVNSPATTVGSLPTPPQKTGFAFGGWYTQTCGGGSEFTAGTAVNGNITVYAKWTLDNMVAIPGKTYKMLSTEVTQGLYTSVMGSNPSYNKAGDNYPVEKVTWYDAAAFCNALSTEMGLAPVYTINGNDVTQDISKNGFRLPTIEEWVYSGKGGQNYTYAGSNTPGEVAWYIANANSTTHPVGQKNPNGYGLYDMTGNVSEWCWDSRKPEQIIYHYVKGSNYSTGSGASFNDINDNETEVYYGPNDKYDYLGFRIVCKQ